MPITQFLTDQAAFSPDDIRVMSQALQEACTALNVNGDARAREAVAIRIIELGRRGERDPIRLRDRVIAEANGGTHPVHRENCTMISIVDDDAFVRDATVDLLSSLGYAAAAFESAEKFLDSAHVTDTLCLILDQHLPGLNGLELQNQLLLDGHRAAIIFITAFPDQKAREQALKAGAVAYLSKPYQQDQLIGALRVALSGGR